MLNKQLLEKQGIDEEGEKLILSLHEQLQDVLHRPKAYENPVDLIEDLEYCLQNAWKFGRDRDKHSWWMEIKGCTCPRMENLDRCGTTYRVISGNCPWHNI